MKDTITIDFEELFPIVEASKLSMNDTFMRYHPRTYEQFKLYKGIVEAINSGSGLHDFRKNIMDPAKDENGKIVFQAGKEPAVGETAIFWENIAKEIVPRKNSRLPTKKEYYAFCGVIIKKLVEKQGYKIAEAWETVCDDSHELGHYSNSVDAKGKLEETGKRKVAGFYDLANTCKIIKTDDGSKFFNAGGCYIDKSFNNSISCLDMVFCPDEAFDYSVGAIVCDV